VRVTVLTKTLKDAGYDNIFTEVKHTEALGLTNPNQLRMFHLDVSNNKFSFDAMHEFLLKNIGRYVFSRAKMEQFRIDDDLESVGAKAIHLLKKAAITGTNWIGDELGDILLYVFLEQMLGAPKLFSKIELNGFGTATSEGSVHLLPLANNGSMPSYQMVFGKSKVKGDMKHAINNAFEQLVSVRDNSACELQIVENTVFMQSYDAVTAEKLKDIIIPSKKKNAIVDKAFGVFLGYSLGLDATKFSNADFRKELTRKMDLDIKAHVAYIAEKIEEANMKTHSFYFYILPFNDADSERTSIMTTLLEGGA
jgi:hypothetical protein